MKSVNLVPADARKRRGAAVTANPLQVPTYLLLGLLAGALVLVTIYVLTGNTISDRNARLSSLQAQVSQTQAEAARLGDYGRFVQTATSHLQTVDGIAATRFDWHEALADLSQVVPANTSLQTLSGTVAPGATAGGGGAGTGGTLRTQLTTPALELVGCTSSQDDVARLMSRLRLVDGVTRVTLASTEKSASTTASAGTQGGCPAGSPTFDLLVFFKALPGAGPNGATMIPSVTTSQPGGGA